MRRLAAILSADAVGYSRLMAEDDQATISTIKACRNAIDEVVAKNGGRVVDAVGDNVLAEFSTALDAARCAVAIQSALRSLNAKLPDKRRMEFRVGVHLGDVTAEGERIYGNGVNIAARLQALAEPGGICISGAVHDEVASKLEQSFEDLGEQQFKNIPRLMRAFAIRREHSSNENSRPLPTKAERTSIAVLPFSNLSGDPEQEYFSDGITEELITELTRFRELSVVGRSRTFEYKGQAIEPRKVGAELDVQYLLEGTVRKAGNRVRVTARLLSASNDVHLWAETYERELIPANVFAVQDDIKQRIVATIADSYGAISRAALAKARRTAPETLGAYEAILLGRSFLSIDATSKAHLRAREALERATESEPDNADAWAWLAGMYRDEYGWGFNLRADPLERAAKAAHRSLELDPNNQQAHLVLSHVHAFRHQVDDFVRVAERALAMNPNSPDLLAGTALFMSWAGIDRGAVLAEKALSLAPDLPGWCHIPLALHHYLHGEYELVLEEAQHIHSTPGWEAHAHLLRGAAFGQLGRKDEGMAELERLLEIHPKFPSQVRDHWLRRVNVPEAAIDKIVEGLESAGLAIPE